MFSFFRRKKDEAQQPAKPSTLSAEDLAAAFPRAPPPRRPRPSIPLKRSRKPSKRSLKPRRRQPPRHSSKK